MVANAAVVPASPFVNSKLDPFLHAEELTLFRLHFSLRGDF